MRRRSSNGGTLSLDRILTVATTVIGALTMVIWGIVWMNLTNVMSRTSTLEGDKRVIEQQLKNIGEAQQDIKGDMKGMKEDLKDVKEAVDSIKK